MTFKIIEILTPQDHCDFLALRNLLLAHHMQDLKETTHTIHYKNFRCEKLKEMMSKQVIKILCSCDLILLNLYLI